MLDNKGSAIIMSIFLLLIVGTLSTAFLIVNNSNLRLSSNSAAATQAFYAAEGGSNFLDLYLNKFYHDKIAGKSIFSADEIKPELDLMLAELNQKNIKLDNYNLSYSYQPDENYQENNLYLFKVKAQHGLTSKTISIQYKIDHLIDYFRFSRFANKINISGDSYFYNVDPHSFGTAEKRYYNWSPNRSYNQGDLVVYNNQVYISSSDYNPGEAVEPGQQDWQKNWTLDISYQPWDREKIYNQNQIVIRNNNLYLSLSDNNDGTPGRSSSWQLAQPDLVTETNLSRDNVEYGLTSLPNKDDYDYQEKIVAEFKTRLASEGGYTYQDTEPDTTKYNTWSNKVYRTGSEVINNGKVYKAIREKWSLFWRVAQPEPGVGSNWGYYWQLEDAVYNFFNDDTDYEANYILIDGDFNPTESEIKYFDKPNDQVLHILIDGEIKPAAEVSLRGRANIIIYTTADLVSFEAGHITMPWESEINLAYFAPFATYTSNNFRGGYASSMVFNEINLNNERISSVTTYSDDNPLRGSIDPGIAELTRIHGNPNFEIDKTGPVRLIWND